MLQSTTMTYLIVGRDRNNIYTTLIPLLSKLWEREITKEEVFDSNNPDIHILDGSNLSSIGIEDIKGLQKEMVFSPFKETTQIAYILNAEKLTVQAQNSLLKTLEESSGKTAYILTTSNEKDLLPTVLSRCLKLYSTEIAEARNVKNPIGEFLQLDTATAFQKPSLYVFLERPTS